MTGNESRTKRRLALAVLATALAVAATVQVASGVAKTGATMGSLTFEAALGMTSRLGPCPPGSPPDADLCAARTGSGAVRGLGEVSETYTFFVQEGDCDRVFETTVRLEVAGKGELQLAVDRYRGECISSSLNLSRTFTITGGSGIYAGASGGGTVSHRGISTPSGSVGRDTWTGTLSVPGLEFDVTPPTLSGAVNKTVRARRGSKRVRVTYRVTASDAVDGSVPVLCQPRSRSRFKIGRSFVKCSATDTSANAKTGRFRVIVKRG
ncbi:MAG TPA: HYR domain-containing protein [Gaiellaceae bacterium]|nr:HYR domain-containing protein [Gaiellaceae bacterium]